jgi:hypothetical protein
LLSSALNGAPHSYIRESRSRRTCAATLSLPSIPSTSLLILYFWRWSVRIIFWEKIRTSLPSLLLFLFFKCSEKTLFLFKMIQKSSYSFSFIIYFFNILYRVYTFICWLLVHKWYLKWGEAFHSFSFSNDLY